MMCYLTTSEIRYVYGQSNRCINTAMIKCIFRVLNGKCLVLFIFCLMLPQLMCTIYGKKKLHCIQSADYTFHFWKSARVCSSDVNFIIRQLVGGLMQMSVYLRYKAPSTYASQAAQSK